MTQPVEDEVPPLVVSVQEIATRIGLPYPLDDQAEAIVLDAILNAQAEVEGYLGRNITPMTFVQTGCIAYTDGWHLDEPKVISVTSAVPETDPIDGGPTGRYTVTYVAGIDARQPVYNPIRRYVKGAALADSGVADLWRRTVGDKSARRIRSVSVEGQSESFDYLTPGGGIEGSGAGRTGSAIAAIDTAGIGRPVLKSMDRWRLARRRAFQRPGRTAVDRSLNSW